MEAFNIEVLLNAVDNMSPALKLMSGRMNKASVDAKELDERLKSLRERAMGVSHLAAPV